MPALWPKFIINVSKKLASKSASSPDDIGTFVANEYFNAVKTAQTPFGNIHKPGQKQILETGFKKAFNMLFKSTEPNLEDKFGNPSYADMLEKLPPVDLSANPDCDFEEWVVKNKETLEPFQFYHFFKSNCEIPKPKVPEKDVFGEVNILPENEANQRYVTMSVIGGDGVPPYQFTYSLNGVIQPTLTSDSTSVIKFLAPVEFGKYVFTLISAIDSTNKVEIKNINKSVTLELSPDADAEINADIEAAKPLKPMTEKQQIDEIVKRVINQNDGSEEYLDWVERLSFNGSFPTKVGKKVLEFFDKESTVIKVSTGINGLPQTAPVSLAKITILNVYDYQRQIDSANESIKKAKEKYNKLVTKSNLVKVKVDSIEKSNARIEVIRSEIFLENIEFEYKKKFMNFGTSSLNNLTSSSTSSKIELLNKQIAVELQLINIDILKKNINKIKDVDSIDFIMANIKIYQNELTIAQFQKDNRKIDTLNRELTVQSLRIIKLKNKTKKEEMTNDRMFQEEHVDRPDKIVKNITGELICVCTYVKGIDDNQKGAPDKNPKIAESNSSVASSQIGQNSFVFGSSFAPSKTTQTFKEWSKRTEKNRISAKLKKYDIEKNRFRELQKKYTEDTADKAKKNENPCGADDGYCVMSKCIIDYWKSTAAQPFQKAPPILPCLIPDPGSFIPVSYGDEAKLGADLRKAWNTGKSFKVEPATPAATKAVAVAVAVSCAKHLKDLKFMYNGKIPGPNGPIPMIGFSPTAL